MSTAIATIGELAQVIAGFSPRPEERRKRGRYLLLGGRNIKDGVLVKTDADSYVDEVPRGSFTRAIARVGDVIVSTLFDRRKLYEFSEGDSAAVVNSSCAIIRSSHSGDYIVSYLRTVEGERDFLDKASKVTGGTFIPRLSVASLAAIEIPISCRSQNWLAWATLGSSDPATMNSWNLNGNWSRRMPKLKG